MTGPEHYREAERCAVLAAQEADEGLGAAAQVDLTFAQVHATLALAAATAMTPDMTADEWPGWRDAAGSEETRSNLP